jgi:hypothetical protein
MYGAGNLRNTTQAGREPRKLMIVRGQKELLEDFV